MRIVSLIVIVAVVVFLILRGGGGAETQSVGATKPRAVEPQSSQTTGAAPSPGNDPNMHNSPTRRLGF